MMGISEYTKIVFEKIQKIEPENATKIIGCLLLQDNCDEEISRLAMAPDHLIHEVILKAKAELKQRLATKLAISPVSNPMYPAAHALSHLSAVSPRNFVHSPTFQVSSSPLWDPQIAGNNNADFIPPGYLDNVPELHNQRQLFGYEKNHLEPINVAGLPRFSSDNFNYLDSPTGNLNSRTGRRMSLSEFPVKTCHYFNKGFCKHGSSCRYYHGQLNPDIFSQMYGNDTSNDDQVFQPGSLAQLEMEIIELLKPRRGNPMSIASLPMAYYDKYKKVLQAEGYLTESQRHGKAGYSLTKLLARLKNSIRLIDRPHGQHAVVLAEDAPKYLENRNENFGPVVSASRQIYLTFPAESTFTEEDVSNYFNTFGRVEDVRIPCQQKRMFGFVTFFDADTVQTILEKGNPHFVRGSRVLVKPYREKSKLVERKCSERIEAPLCYSPHYLDMDSELISMQRGYEDSRFPTRQIIEEPELALEFERRHLAELKLAQKSLVSPHHFGYSMDGIKVPEDCFSFGLGDKPKHADTAYTDQDSNQGLNLPDSPFASPIATGNSTVI